MTLIQQQQQHFPLANPDPGEKISISPPPIPSPSSSLMPSVLPQPPTAKAMSLRHWQSQPLLRTKASTQLSPFHAQAQPCHSTQPRSLNHHNEATSLDVPTQSQPSSSIVHAAAKTHSFSDWNRTQQKLMLQRQSFLASDKHHLDHPANMKRLTKEMDRMNREYRCVRQYEDPMAESFLRVTMTAYHHPIMHSSTSPQFSSLSSSSASSSASSSLSSSGLLDSALSTRNICNTTTITNNNKNNNNNNNISHHLYYANQHYYQQQHQQQHPQQQQNGKIASPVLQRRASDFMLKQQDRRNSSTSIHSAIIERSHHPSSASSSSKNLFFTRWFKPALPPTKRRQLHTTC
ncbi:hypothetical protein BCR42DRAFT_410133 [Absidia repens]|uniref:Uncharacterized protein n=1 Tax=Absidia repens TaxID=90262 RepID=A0A1X2INN2_9FUNG|nr:hypothetical protein BCR42DRAFT_410133 [Absidia repens]